MRFAENLHIHAGQVLWDMQFLRSEKFLWKKSLTVQYPLDYHDKCQLILFQEVACVSKCINKGKEFHIASHPFWAGIA